MTELPVAGPHAGDLLARCFEQNTPLLLKGAARGWLAEGWSDAHLARTVGDRSVTVEVSRTGRFGHEERAWRSTRMLLSRFLRTYRARQREHLYAVFELPDALARELTLPAWLPYPAVETLGQATLWLGAGGQVSLLHNDNRDNLLCVFDGRKRVTLIDGLHGEALQERRELRDKVTPVDPTRPDFERSDALREVGSLVADVEAGDALYIPVCWFHQVHSEGRNLAVNLWFDLHDIETRLAGTGGAGLSSARVLAALFDGPRPAAPPMEPRPIRLADTRRYRARR